MVGAVVSACSGGSGEGLDDMGLPVLEPKFSAIQANVFTPTCAVSGCHTGAGAPQGLRLDAASSYGLLVGVPSSEVPSLDRVEPGDPANSYLVRKLEGTASVGARMPLGEPPLEQSVINVIRQWIIDGALDDRTQSSRTLQLTSMSPLPGETLTASPAAVIAAFNRELDVSTVHALTFSVIASGGDGTFDDGNESAVPASRIVVAGPSRNVARLEFDGRLPADTYQVRIRAAGAAGVLDIAANSLDGEFDDAFPSGDGTEGGDFRARFTLER